MQLFNYTSKAVTYTKHDLTLGQKMFWKKELRKNFGHWVKYEIVKSCIDKAKVSFLQVKLSVSLTRQVFQT